MRIIAGSARGRVIKMPKGAKVRPTQDRVREAIFNIIKEIVPQAKVLDLYAGSGAFGIEALSRGADFSAFVDNNPICIKTIKGNLSVIEKGEAFSEVFRMDSEVAISKFEQKKKLFDIVFLDPPYHKDLAKNCLIKLDACDILSQHGFVIIEHSNKDILPSNISKLARTREKPYGDTVISFYRKTI